MRAIVIALACVLALPPSAAAQEKAAAEKSEAPRPLAIDDYFALGEVSDPQPSPDGEWIAYTVTRHDLEEDENRSRVWMVPSAGGDAVALTAEDETSSRPRWSPDGRHLAFLSGRDEAPAQVWTLFRHGGEAVQLTDTAQKVAAYEWSPDGKRLVLVLQDPKPSELEAKEAKEKGEEYEEKTPPPWIITRQQFKTDYVGYLDSRRTHLYLLDVASKEMRQLTAGDYDDAEPAWSPDGTRIAFTSNRTQSPDASYDTDVWVVAADRDKPAQTADLTRVSNNPGTDASPAWSPDGSRIAHVSTTDVEAMLYATYHLAVSRADGTGSRFLTERLDRWVANPRFAADGESIFFTIQDRGTNPLVRLPLAGGEPERLVDGDRIVLAFELAPGGGIAALVALPQQPPEVYLWADGALAQRTFTNAELLSKLTLGTVEEVSYASADGTPLHGFVIKPPGFEEGRRYPTILDIHGGPQAQYDWGFQFEGQLYAANGYLVLHPNPRGSTGYGQEFCMGIWQEWGNPDYEDVMAAVDDAIARGWADPAKLGVVGWSYGGMLTNHVITKTDRFKAAATGASATLYVANYGHDMYQLWWEQELGLPWEPEARKLWERLSPFNRVEQVTTPTLVLCGERDWNVPVINSEQLYLALRRLGVETELVVYPGEYHGIDTPTHTKDLYERYLAWFGKHLKGEVPAAKPEKEAVAAAAGRGRP